MHKKVGVSADFSKLTSRNRWNHVSRSGNNAFMNTMPSIKEMQRAYLRKDTSYDGIFFLGVRTTGIFCRPSCPARKPSRTLRRPSRNPTASEDQTSCAGTANSSTKPSLTSTKYRCLKRRVPSGHDRPLLLKKRLISCKRSRL